MDSKEINTKTKFKKIDDYQFLQSIGRGANGFVYKGLNTLTGSLVAIKEMLIGKSQMKSIKTELNFLKKLENPNIVKYIDAIQKQNKMYLVLEYVEGGSLGGLVKKSVLSENVIKIYIKQILSGLAFLHKSGVIHRDIKGANILITKHGRVKLADFGVAVRIQQTKKTISAAGSPYWIAPEVIIGQQQPTIKCDIWSLGCTIIELLTGNPPYFDLMQFPALFRIVEDEHPPLPDCGQQCRDFLLKCFQKQPQKRPQASQLLLHSWFKSVSNENLDKFRSHSQITGELKSHLSNKIDYQSLYRLTDQLPSCTSLYQNQMFFNILQKGQLIPNIILYFKMIKHNFQTMKFLFGAGFIQHSFSRIIASPDSYFNKKDIQQIVTLLSLIIDQALINDYIYTVLPESLPVFSYFLQKITNPTLTYEFINILHRIFHNQQSINNSQLCTFLNQHHLIQVIVLPLVETAENEDLIFMRIQISLKVYENWNYEGKYKIGQKLIKQYLSTLNEESNNRIIFGKVLILSVMVTEEPFQLQMQRNGVLFCFSQFLRQKSGAQYKSIIIKIIQILDVLLEEGHRGVQFERHGGLSHLSKWISIFDNEKGLIEKIKLIEQKGRKYTIEKWK